MDDEQKTMIRQRAMDIGLSESQADDFLAHAFQMRSVEQALEVLGFMQIFLVARKEIGD